jgi:DNA-binding LacI/PurR family transcriptional regulator
MSPSRVEGVYRKAEVIADDLRSAIVGGEYDPGERLPTRQTLCERYGVSNVTVQRAFDRLAREGFVVSVERQGTFVAEDSPHLTRYALLFPGRPGVEMRNQFFMALAREAEDFSEESNFELHYGFEGHTGVERYRVLLDDVRNRRLAGLIFASSPLALKNSPIVKRPGIPRAAFMSPSPELDLPAVTVDHEDFLRKVVAEVEESGRRRVAAIASTQQGMESVRKLQDRLREAGVEINPSWYQGVSIGAAEWAEPLTRLLMEGRADARPDCLIVTDDNLLPPVSRLLEELDLSVPDDLHLIAHCNFPWPTPGAEGAVRIGYCMGDCLHALMRQIDAQREGEEPVPVIRIPAYHESEYPRTIHRPQWLPVGEGG